METQQPPPPSPNSGDSIKLVKKKMKSKKKKNRQTDVVSDSPQQRSMNSASSSSSPSNNFINLKSKRFRLSRNPNRVFTQKRSPGEADALALPLGMSIAAFVAKVLEKKDEDGEKMSVDHLSEICTLAVKESLFKVFGDKFDCFVSNFERSFQSTLMTLRAISESLGNRERSYFNKERSSNNFRFDTKNNISSTSQEQSTIDELHVENVNEDSIYNGQQLTCVPLNRLSLGVNQSSVITTFERSVFEQARSNNFHFDTKDNISSTSQEQSTIDELHVENVNEDSIYNGQQLTCVPLNRLSLGVNQSSVITTFERSVSEQARSNDLKELEISLKMKSMKLKEAQIAVDCDANVLERFKLSMGISKANFKAGKFKTELEDSRHAELLKKCADFLVAGLLIMLTSLGYGTYIHSHQRLTEATESCNHMKESSSWWKPVASFNAGFQVLQCQVQVISRMLFGLWIISAITHLLFQRWGTASQTMPITFLLLLGFGCGFAGKLCVDSLGGNGNHWLFYWELLCLIHIFAKIWTSVLFVILHGPVNVTNQSTSHKLFPYWFRRRVVFYPALFLLPLLCGLMPFAGPLEWFQHFATFLVYDESE